MHYRKRFHHARRRQVPPRTRHRRPRAKFVRVLPFVDNAAYHRSANLRRRLAGWDGDVVIRYLPPYTPELNPVEVQWRMTRKAAANAPCADTGAMKMSVRRMLRTGEVGVAEMSHYLLG